ncbi:ROK family protein [Oryzibacter oryziterrae]|uniref:ROK family protein n=1 Tax=Oryzibacter oryziterrae TaxID=2766474 RepID=UPI001F2AE32D|nr:ROK family protein [Oryzibacter oryziterrae]
MSTRPARTGQGSNSVQVRQFNERIVLQCLRRMGEASKADLARAAALTNNAIGDIIRDLESVGLVSVLGKKREGQRGQPATMLALESSGAYSIGVRLDRVSSEVLCVDFGGNIVSRRSRDVILPPPDDMLAMIVSDINAILDDITPNQKARLAGIGLALPFNLGSWLRELELPAESFKLWDGYDFAMALARETGMSVFTENDGNAAAIAELFYGRGRQIDDFVYIFIGGAVGGGVVVSGDCLHGVNGNAGDIAMLTVPASTLASAPAPQKAFDVLLTRASLTALRRHMRWHGLKVESLADMADALSHSDRHRALDEWIDDAVAAFVPAILSATAVLDVPNVVLDCNIDDGLIQTIIERLEKALEQAAPESVRVPMFYKGSFGHDAGALGAATLPLFVNFSPRSSILTGTAGAIKETQYAAAE